MSRSSPPGPWCNKERNSLYDNSLCVVVYGNDGEPMGASCLEVDDHGLDAEPKRNLVRTNNWSWRMQEKVQRHELLSQEERRKEG